MMEFIKIHDKYIRLSAITVVDVSDPLNPRVHYGNGDWITANKSEFEELNTKLDLFKPDIKPELTGELLNTYKKMKEEAS